MKTLWILLASALGLATVCGCGSAQNPVQENGLHSLLKQRLGSTNEIVFNTSGTFALAYQLPGVDHVHRKFKYLVVRVADRLILHEGYFRAGYVKWYDNHSIEVSSASGSVKNDSSTKRIITVNSPH